MMSPITFAATKTVGGYFCGDVTSALQKAIRRGQEPEAIFWATELELSGFGNYLWKRLRLIASEDVGIGDNDCAVLVRSLYENWKDLKDKERPGPGRYMIVHAVIALVRAPKSRIVDSALLLFCSAKDRPHFEIPDEAYDRHTAKGKRMGRGFAHFFDEAAKVNNPAKIKDPYAKACRDTIVEHGLHRRLDSGEIVVIKDRKPRGQAAQPDRQLELTPRQVAGRKAAATKRRNAGK